MASKQVPSVGRIVHYRSYGTPGGEFTPQCRAAIITGIVASKSDRGAILHLAIFNPSGQYFAICDEDQTGKKGGTWHWPEFVAPVEVDE